MKATIRERLAQVSARYEEVGLLLSDPEVFSNANRYRDLSREYAQLEPLVKSWRHWRENDAAISEARQMLEEQDSELREMAAEELEAGEQRRQELDDGNLGAELGVHRSELEPDVPRADHDQVAGHGVVAERFGAGADAVMAKTDVAARLDEILQGASE